MGMIQSGVHFSLRQLTRKSHAQFLSERKNLRQTQLAILNRLLAQSEKTTWGQEKGIRSDWTYSEMQTKINPTNWNEWSSWVEREKAKSGSMSIDVTRYQPTSGSTHKRKWIPYTRSFLNEIDRATAVWIHDLYEQSPGVREGKHYWSLSWLPTELRKEMSNNDLAYFPWLKRLFLGQVMAIDDSVQRAETSDLARRLTIQKLIECRELSLISVWSPTFLLGICHDLWSDKSSYARHASKGTRDIILQSANLEDCLNRLWPRLSLVSCWQTADAAHWAKKTQQLFSGVPFQGKGLFATEGVVSIPVQGKMHLAYQSHFYEFEKKNREIIPAFELKAGDEVTVLISTGSGLWRYRMGDRVLVVELEDGCPILQFLGREHTVDMVGEKLSFDAARDVLNKLGEKAIIMLASPGDQSVKPGYEIVWEGVAPGNLAERAEMLLKEHHHYLLARELNQLAPARVRECTKSGEFFQSLAREMNWVLGDMKWEALMKLPKNWENT